MKTQTVITSIVIIVGVLSVAAGLTVWKKHTDRAAQAAKAAGGWEPAESVQLVPVKTGTHQRSMSATGTVWAVRHVNLATEVSGKVESIGFESGQIVEQGALLVRLDSSTEQADLRAAEAAVELARVTLERYRQALTGKAVSEREIDKAQAELVQAQARVQQLKAMIDKKDIRAPFRGRIGIRDTHPGQYLSEGQRITTLQDVSDQVNVDFSIPQTQAAGLRVGSDVTIIVGAALGKPTEVPAKVSAFDSQIDLATRNAKIRATLDSMNGRLSPGMFVDVRVPLGEPAPVLTVPPTAVRHAPFGDHVFVVAPDEKDPSKLRARQRFVKLGGAAGDQVIIADGLKAGEQLAADGSFKLREGVIVMAAPPPAPASPAPAKNEAAADHAKSTADRSTPSPD